LICLPYSISTRTTISKKSQITPYRTSTQRRSIASVSDDVPPLIEGLDVSLYEKHIYKTKKRMMYIAIKDFRAVNKNYFTVRQGDLICSVFKKKGWHLVYNENNPKKFGFAPGTHLNLID